MVFPPTPHRASLLSLRTNPDRPLQYPLIFDNFKGTQFLSLQVSPSFLFSRAHPGRILPLFSPLKTLLPPSSGINGNDEVANFNDSLLNSSILLTTKLLWHRYSPEVPPPPSPAPHSFFSLLPFLGRAETHPGEVVVTFSSFIL